MSFMSTVCESSESIESGELSERFSESIESGEFSEFSESIESGEYDKSGESASHLCMMCRP